MLPNSRLLIIPDVHGRAFWRDAVEKAGEMPVVFLGDYLDPYPDEAISPEETWEGFVDIVALKKDQPDRVTLLLGNHDLAYVNSAIAGSRFDRRNAKRNRAFFFENMDLFDLTCSFETQDRRYRWADTSTEPMVAVFRSEEEERTRFRLC